MEETQTKRIAIQGYPGAFHEIAARLYFAEQAIEIVPADTFEQLVSMVTSNQNVDIGIMAIENSIVGSMMPNYNLINQSSLQISGEIFIRIKQNLLVLPGTNMEALKEVHSHYMAIAQCKEFFADYPHIKLVETSDTALSAKHIAQNQHKNIGAIASQLAGQKYDLHCLTESIETNKKNYTRFFIVEPATKIQNNSSANYSDASIGNLNPQVGYNKTSISFTTSHEKGSLCNILKVLEDGGANLTKIQSSPILGQPWEYLFYVDFLKEDTATYDLLIRNLNEITHHFKVLGRYKSGIHHED